MTPAAAFAEREERGINSQTAEMQGVAMMKRALTFQRLEPPYPCHVRGKTAP
jgi:hypothetical protein